MNNILLPLFLMGIELYLIYRLIHNYINQTEDAPKETFDFPNSDWIKTTYNNITFIGYIVGKAYIENDTPLLIAKGILGNSKKGYVFFFGDIDAHITNFEMLDTPHKYEYIKNETIPFENIYYPEEDFVRLEDEQAIHEAIGQIKVLQSIDMEKVESGEYSYRIEDINTNPIIEKTHYTLWDIPYILREMLKKVSWYYILAFFILLILSVKYKIFPDIMKLGYSVPFFDIVMYRSSIFIVLYFVIYTLYKKDYWSIIYMGIVGYIFNLLVIVPLLVNGYYVVFQMLKKPFNYNVKGYYCYYIDYNSNTDKFESKYGWFNIRYKDNTFWNYTSYLKVDEPIGEYSDRLYTYIEHQTKDMNIQKHGEINTYNCVSKPCKIVTPYDVKADLNIVGYEAFGKVIIDKIIPKNQETAPSLIDQYTYTEIKKKKDYSDSVIFVAIPIQYQYHMEDTIAVFSWMGVAMDRNISKQKEIVLTSNYDYENSYNLLQLEEDNPIFEKENASRYLRDFQKNHVENTMILMSSIYLIPKGIQASVSILNKDLKKYNYYYVLYENDSFDGLINFYKIKKIYH